ncbi:MAG TPA: 3-oxoacyl-ACP synthase III family protein [Nostocaceae cyanobacterium]|nr:3-oxoacyl-ACP synthase III family protein [Nostocaceae cyanobacterium]
MHNPVGIRSLALSFPSIIRTKDYYKEKYPELVAQSEKKSLAKLMSLVKPTPSSEFEMEMIPYLSDPFRGMVEKRVLAPGETSLTIEYGAAKDAIVAAKLSPRDVDLIIGCSVLPERIVYGSAAYIAAELGIQSATWNLDATCASTPVALQTACALVQTGMYRNILVVVSFTFSRLVDENSTLSWFFGDAAGAFLVSSLGVNQGILGTKTVNTSALCDSLYVEIEDDEQSNPQLRVKVSKSLNKVMSETATDLLRTCCEGAVAAAGVTLDDIDFFIVNTSTAWFANFCIRVLGIDPDRIISCYPAYANIGPVLSLANLYHAAQLGKIRENDLVLIYGFGAASSACATVMRWGDVALGSAPVQGASGFAFN